MHLSAIKDAVAFNPALSGLLQYSLSSIGWSTFTTDLDFMDKTDKHVDSPRRFYNSSSANVILSNFQPKLPPQPTNILPHCFLHNAESLLNMSFSVLSLLGIKCVADIQEPNPFRENQIDFMPSIMSPLPSEILMTLSFEPGNHKAALTIVVVYIWYLCKFPFVYSLSEVCITSRLEEKTFHSSMLVFTTSLNVK